MANHMISLITNSTTDIKKTKNYFSPKMMLGTYPGS